MRLIDDLKLLQHNAKKRKAREEARIRKVVGYLSAEVPELHTVEMGRLAEATNKAIEATK